MNAIRLFNPWVALGILLVGGACFAFGFRAGSDHEIAKAVTQKELFEKLEKSVAENVAKIQVRHTTIKGKTEVITREVPVYRDCVNDPAVERLLDAARENRDAPAGDRGVPGSGASSTPDVR